MNTKKLLPPAEAAEHLGVPVVTLSDWRHKGRGPSFIKVGRLVRYDPEDLNTWINARKVRATNE